MHNPRLPCWFPTKSDALLQLCILMLCIKKKLTVHTSYLPHGAGVLFAGANHFIWLNRGRNGGGAYPSMLCDLIVSCQINLSI